MEAYDLIVLGGGPAGCRAALEFTRHKPKARVALVERMAVVGGVCVNTGTIPSKTLREAVIHLSGYRQRDSQEEGSSLAPITQEKLRGRIQRVIALELATLEKQLGAAGVELVSGSARFVSPHEVEVCGCEGSRRRRLWGASIVIATGSEAARTEGFPYDGATVIIPDELMNLEGLPRSMIIIGGGVIGSEYASIYALAGVKVLLVDGRTSILGFLDEEVRAVCVQEMERTGVVFRLGRNVAAVERTESGSVRVVYKEGGEKEGGEDEADLLVTAAGRVAATRDLDLAAAGLEADSRGRIPVDPVYRTRVPHIFAVGDVIGFPSLAATATEQGRVVAAVAAGHPAPSLAPLLPFGIYTIPEMAALGPTERELAEKKQPYRVARGHVADTSRGHISGQHVGLLKLLWDPGSRHILGVHLVGEGATELVHVGHAVMALGGTVDYFIESVFNYPTLAQVYKLAADEIARADIQEQ